MASISFKVSKTGEVSLEVSGAPGMTCEELTRCFEDALGTRTKVEYKPEEFLAIDGIDIHVKTGG